MRAAYYNESEKQDTNQRQDTYHNPKIKPDSVSNKPDSFSHDGRPKRARSHYKNEHCAGEPVENAGMKIMPNGVAVRIKAET